MNFTDSGDSKKIKAKKCFSMLFDVWIISVIWIVVMMILRSGDIEPGFIIRSLFPSLFGNNWYLTCYLLFYPFHTVFNSLIARFDRKTHLRIVIRLGIPYLFINSMKEELLYATELTTWIALYFLVAYIKKYYYEDLMKRKTTIVLIIIGITGFIFEIVMTDLLGLNIGFFRKQMLHWGKNSNPFIIMTVLGLLSVFLKLDMKNKVINYISSLMMLVFIIHENIIFSAYMRPYFYVFIHDTFGYRYISLWVIIGSLSLFGIALVIAVIYDNTLRIIVKKISALVCDLCAKTYLKIENKLIKT